MNIMFWILLLIGVIFMWVALRFVFKSIGWVFRKVFDDTANIITFTNEEDGKDGQEEKEEENK